MRGDWATYDREIEWARGTPDEPFLMFWKANGQSGLGSIKAARQLFQQSRSELLSTGVKDFAGGLFSIEASNDALIGYPADAREEAAKCPEIAKDSGVRGYAAHAFALAGDTTKSASLLAELTHEYPDNQFSRLIISPLAQAAQDLQKNQPEQAIAALETVRPYELGTGPHGAGFMPNHLRGVAYLKLGDGAKAATEFQRIPDHQGVSASDITYALARLNLGRAYVLQGDNTKARTAYQDFLARWKDADSDIPVLRQAKAEYAKLPQ
jgi:tetratricopeptide (TPR) repeat protein